MTYVTTNFPICGPSSRSRLNWLKVTLLTECGRERRFGLCRHHLTTRFMIFEYQDQVKVKSVSCTLLPTLPLKKPELRVRCFLNTYADNISILLTKWKTLIAIIILIYYGKQSRLRNCGVSQVVTWMQVTVGYKSDESQKPITEVSLSSRAEQNRCFFVKTYHASSILINQDVLSTTKAKFTPFPFQTKRLS